MSETEKEPLIRFKGFTEDWEQRRFGDIAPLRRGLTYKPSDVIDDKAGVRVLRSSNIDEDRFVLKDDDVFVRESAVNIPLVSNGEILITAANGSNRLVGKRALISGLPSKTAHGGFMLLASPKYPLFVNAFMGASWYRRFINTNVVGGNGAIGNLNKDSLEQQEVLIPKPDEQVAISEFFHSLDHLITLHQRKCDLLEQTQKTYLQRLFPRDGENVPEIRFKGYTNSWKQRRLGEQFTKVNERNDGTLGKNRWISVAKMYFQDPEKVQSNNIDTRTYIMREGDIAFEGHPNAVYKFGRFVANDIGTGVVSELFPIYRHKQEYDANYWKYAIQLERIMAPIFANSITSSGNSSNKLDPKHFLRQKIYIPSIKEQQKIGAFFRTLDTLTSHHQQKLTTLKTIKQTLLSQMFI